MAALEENLSGLISNHQIEVITAAICSILKN